MNWSWQFLTPLISNVQRIRVDDYHSVLVLWKDLSTCICYYRAVYDTGKLGDRNRNIQCRVRSSSQQCEAPITPLQKDWDMKLKHVLS